MKIIQTKYKSKCVDCAEIIKTRHAAGYIPELKKVICISCIKKRNQSECDSTAKYIEAAESAYFERWWIANSDMSNEDYYLH